ARGSLSSDALLGLELRCAGCGLGKGANNCLVSHWDLEVVITLALRSHEQPVGDRGKGGGRCRPAGKFCLREAVAPGLVGDPAECHADVDDRSVLDVERGGDGDQRKSIGEPVAELQVAVVGSEMVALQPYSRDNLAVLQGIVALWMVARQTVKL